MTISTSWQRVVQLGADGLVSVLARLAAQATPTSQPTRTSPRTSDSPPTDALRELVYELLDAHYDTAVLAAELAADPGWSQHLHYLSELQRVGRERLAQTTIELVA